MTTLPDDPTQELSDLGPPDPAPTSRAAALAALRREHAQIGKNRAPLILEVPGLEHMAVRYVWYPLSADEKAARKAQQMGLKDASLLVLQTTLLNACDEILLMDPDDPRADDDGWAPLTEPGEPPIKFDRVLCEVMEWPNPEVMSGRAIVAKLFGGEEGERALIKHAARVLRWLDGEAADAQDSFAGN